jgi:peptide/nickel transport system ATP-binding protein
MAVPAGRSASRAHGESSATRDSLDAPPVLEADELRKEYRRNRRTGVVTAVAGVSLQLRPGRVVALVGGSGSGKSTIAKLLSGQERPTSGRILLNGEEVVPSARKGFREYKGNVQMVFQDPFASLNPLHTVRYHLERALIVHADRTHRDTSVAGVDALLEEVRLVPAEGFRDAYPHELSGGQRQRVSLARALAADPVVLLADEPVSMLDVSIRLEILDLMSELRDRLSLAVLYITHDIASARYFADDILVMHNGVIVERGDAEEVVQAPSDEYTRLLIASAPDPEAFADEPGA